MTVPQRLLHQTPRTMTGRRRSSSAVCGAAHNSCVARALDGNGTDVVAWACDHSFLIVGSARDSFLTLRCSVPRRLQRRESGGDRVYEPFGNVSRCSNMRGVELSRGEISVFC